MYVHLDVTTLASLGANNLWGSIQRAEGENNLWGSIQRAEGENNLWGFDSASEGGCEAGRCWFT